MSSPLKTAIGLALVIIGVISFLDLFGIFEIQWRFISFMFGLLWPLIFVMFGIDLLVAKGKVFWGLVLIAIGTSFELEKILPYSFGDLFLPMMLIVVGISLLAKRDKGTKEEAQRPGSAGQTGTITDATIRENVSFAELNKKVTSKEFGGGKLTCSFGSAKLDLSEAEISAAGAELDINCSFGGVEIRVPKHAKIISDGRAFVGGWEDQTKPEGRPDAPVLKFTGSVSFGGVVIKE